MQVYEFTKPVQTNTFVKLYSQHIRNYFVWASFFVALYFG